MMRIERPMSGDSRPLPKGRAGTGGWLPLGLLLSFGLVTGCATTPPAEPANICAIFAEQDDWYPASLQAQRKWGMPVSVQMAIMKQESAFVADAQPPRRWFLGFIPLSRPSTAYGYSQALDGTWTRYQKSTGNTGAERDDFADAVDFMGWYAHQSQVELGIPPRDAYRQYLAYHEGQGGYERGTYRQKPWLMDVAHKVAADATRYQRQLRGCQPALDAALAFANPSEPPAVNGG
jgi:hypothetical protein